MDAESLRERQRAALFPCVSTLYAEPLVLESAAGTVVRDAEGREYLDFYGGVLTVSLAHCQPDVVAAVQGQAARLGHVSTLYITEPQLRVAERLAALAPGGTWQAFFTNSGTEADETALMLARLHTGRQEVVALRYGYSGRSGAAMSLTGQGAWRPLAAQVAGAVHAVAPYCYRCPLGLTYPDCGVRCAEDVGEVIDTATSGRPAAFIAEPVIGSGGFIVPPPEYYGIAVERVRERGGVFIADEVQSGMGRTGRWFAIEHWGVVPDIITMAKGIANGMPVGATLARPEVAASWDRGLTFSTFGGNPVCMAAAEATLAVAEREALPARAERLGARLRAHLERLAEAHPLIGDVRGLGLMQGIELVRDRATREPAPRETAALLEAAKTRGLLIGRAGLFGNVVRIAPPMLCSEAEIDEAMGRLGEALRTL